MKLTETLLQRGAEQHGLVSRRQALEVLDDRRHLEHLVNVGVLVEVAHDSRIYRFAGAPSTPHQRAMAAVLDAGIGGCVSLRSAGWFWNMPGFRLEPVHTWRIRGRTDHPNRLGIQHRTRILPDHHVCTLDGIPVTTPTRTLADLAAHVHPERFARLVDAAWSRGLTDHARLSSILEDLACRGRSGIRTLREVLEARGPDHRPPESNLEARLDHVLGAAGILGFRRQVLAGGEDPVGRVDFLHESEPLVIEVQSELYHGGPAARAADATRRRSLEDAGFHVLEVWDLDLWHRPTTVVETVRSALRALRDGVAPAA